MSFAKDIDWPRGDDAIRRPLGPVLGVQGSGAWAGFHSEALTVAHAPGVYLRFQDGPIGANGANGTTNEDVIRLLQARLASLNAIHDGRFRCRENDEALRHLALALDWLDRRTAARRARGVEGRDVP